MLKFSRISSSLSMAQQQKILFYIFIGEEDIELTQANKAFLSKSRQLI